MEGEKRMSRALMTPGREDLSPVPPVGQLAFEKIIGMSEQDIDRAFLERHGLQQVFKPKVFQPRRDGWQYWGSDENVAARRLELKRIILARLEGVGIGASSEIWNWYESVKKDIKNPIGSLKTTLKDILTDESKRRISEVWKKVAREAATLAPSPQLRKLEREIQAKLREMHQQPLSIGEIFNNERLPSHVGGLTGMRLNLETGLKLYLLKLNGLSNAECAERLGTTAGTISPLWAVYYTKHAKEVCRTALGMKPKYDRGSRQEAD